MSRSLTTIKIPSFWYYNHWLIYWFLVVTSEVKGGHAIEESSNLITANSTASVAFITTTTTTEKIPTLVFEEPMKNYTKYAGENLKIKCVVRGQPPAKTIKWFKNEAPIDKEGGRIRIRDKFAGGSSGAIQKSQVKFTKLEPLDSGFYKCEASNGLETIRSETVIKVHPRNKRKGTAYWNDDEYGGLEDDYDDSDNGLIPESFPLDLDGGHGGISGLPSHIEFQVRFRLFGFLKKIIADRCR